MHWLFAPIDTLRVKLFTLEQAAFAHGLADYLMAKEPGVVAAEFVRAELNEHQVGLRTENGALVEVLAPATRSLYWKGLVDVQVEVIDIRASAEVPASVVARLVQTQLRQRAVAGLAGVLQVQVSEHGAGILWIDGKVDRLLSAGSYAFWKFNRNVSLELVDLRLHAVEVTGQEVEAGKSAEANVIRRREETAATRSLLNTAKVMEDNPVALRLKELETLERVAERIDKISVFGGLDQVLNGLVKLKT
jgi:regulator of protease activity HflC (stomatin/prohibitin superfamily)